MQVVAFRHMIADGLGSLRQCLERVDASIQVIDTYIEDLEDFNACGPELLIVLGGSPGVYQADLYPFIADEIKILEKRMARDLPTLGICLGAQMMAKALGGNVYPGQPGPEIGWHTLSVNEAGMKTPVRHLDGAATKMLQWHGDTFDLPAGATLLASSPKYKNQIFSYGKNAMALQCHPEVTPNLLAGWFVSASGEAAQGRLDIDMLRRETLQYGQKLLLQTALFMRDWLEQRGFPPVELEDPGAEGFCRA